MDKIVVGKANPESVVVRANATSKYARMKSIGRVKKKTSLFLKPTDELGWWI